MKKRILAAGILMLMFIVTACGNDELVETPVVTDISVVKTETHWKAMKPGPLLQTIKVP